MEGVERATGVLMRVTRHGSNPDFVLRTVLDLLERVRKEQETTLVLVTHDATVAERADRVARMLDGRLDETTPQPRPSLTLVRTLRPSASASKKRSRR